MTSERFGLILLICAVVALLFFVGQYVPRTPLSLFGGPVRVRELLAQKRYEEAFRTALDEIYPFPYEWLTMPSCSTLAIQTLFDHATLIELAREALCGVNAPLSLLAERDTNLNTLAAALLEENRTARFVLKIGLSDASAAQWDDIGRRMTKAKISLRRNAKASV